MRTLFNIILGTSFVYMVVAFVILGFREANSIIASSSTLTNSIMGNGYWLPPDNAKIKAISVEKVYEGQAKAVYYEDEAILIEYENNNNKKAVRIPYLVHAAEVKIIEPTTLDETDVELPIPVNPDWGTVYVERYKENGIDFIHDTLVGENLITVVVTEPIVPKANDFVSEYYSNAVN